MNALQKAIVEKGLAKAPRQRRFKPKTYTCAKCGALMETIENTNIVACTKCSNYFMFNSAKTAGKKGKK